MKIYLAKLLLKQKTEYNKDIDKKFGQMEINKMYANLQ